MTPLVVIQFWSASITTASSGIVTSRLLNAPHSASMSGGAATVVVVAASDVGTVVVVLTDGSGAGGEIASPTLPASTGTNCLNVPPYFSSKPGRPNGLAV